MIRFLFILTTLALFACSEEPDPIDAEPGTMKLTINGTTAVSKYNTAPQCFIYPDETCYIAGYFYDSPWEDGVFDLRLSNIHEGKFKLSGNIDSGSPEHYATFFVVRSGVSYQFYSYQSKVMTAGMVKITELDTVNHTITGYFETKAGRSWPPVEVIRAKGSFNQIPIY